MNAFQEDNCPGWTYHRQGALTVFFSDRVKGLNVRITEDGQMEARLATEKFPTISMANAFDINRDEFFANAIRTALTLKNFRTKESRNRASIAFDIRDGILVKVNNVSGEIVLKPEIRKIGTEAFSGLPRVRSVVVPQGVTEIASKAFFKCPALRRVTIPDTLETMSDDAFCECPIEEFMIPVSLNPLLKNILRTCVDPEPELTFI